MSTVSIAIVTLLVALVVVFCVALIIYLSSLVKNAYQIKVEMRGELDDGMKKIDEELNKRSRWIKRELLEEIEKVKVAMHTDNARRFGEMNDLMRKSVNEFLEGERKERLEINKRIEGLKEVQVKQENSVKRLKRDVRRLGDEWEGEGEGEDDESSDSNGDLPNFSLKKPDLKEKEEVLKDSPKEIPKEASKKEEKKADKPTPASGKANSSLNLQSFPADGQAAANSKSAAEPPPQHNTTA